MTRELALLVIVAVAVLLVGSGVWAWRRRVRRDSALSAPIGEIPADAKNLTVFSGFYVATTRHDEPLERLAIRRLGFRSRVDLTVTTAGVVLDLPGQPRLFLPTARLVGVDRASVAIDRVVERDGLVRLTWHADSGQTTTPVDSYFRPQDASAGALADAVAGILPAPTPTTPTGTDA
ncbi:hypothetical protein [Microbacterium sp. PA5]|uniref:PH-like domain-containing protein n=1 Tax=Microbacterium sp. PA5 TaxID=3416654 RepID=UPI003CE79329